MRNQEEILKQIEGLKNLKEIVPKFSVFGDDNWEEIDTKISILEKSANYEDYEDDDTLEPAAYAAKLWLEGGDNEDLF